MLSRFRVSMNREEVNCVPLSVVSVTLASRLPSGSRSSTDCSTARSASSVRQRCERFHPTISRVQQSITHTRYAHPPPPPPPAPPSFPLSRFPPLPPLPSLRFPRTIFFRLYLLVLSVWDVVGF